LIWGDIQGKAEQVGRPMPVLDSLLAATAISLYAPLVTRNVTDVAQSGVVIVNPWL
jgi:predicted nucleic acid-binding protein